MIQNRIMHIVNRMLYLLLLLAVSVLPTLPHWLDRRLPATHEGYRYLLLSDWFSDALAAGIWYPRWLPEMNGGFGYPEFVFYQPAYFFLNALVSTVAEPLLLRQFCTVSLIALFGGTGLYCLVRRYVEPLHALLLVACFQLAPYVNTNLYLRGDLSEWMVLELAPWPFYFLMKLCLEDDYIPHGHKMRFDLCRGDASGSPCCAPFWATRWDSPYEKRILMPFAVYRPTSSSLGSSFYNSSALHRFLNWQGLALSTAAICYSHPVGLMFLPPLLLFVAGVLLSKKASGSWPGVMVDLAVALTVGLALSAPYWLTVLLMKPQVHVAAALDGFIAWKNTVPLQNLLWGSLIKGSEFQEFLGAPFTVAALLGWWFGRRRPVVFAAGLAYLLIVVAMTPFGQPFWRLYPFSLLQFPWRLAVFAPLLQAVCLIGFYDASGRWRLGRFWLLGGCALLAGWSLIWHFGFKPAELPGSGLRFNQKTLGCLRNFAQISRPGSYISTIDAGEWMPLTAKGITTLPARGKPLSGCESTRQALSELFTKNGMPDIFSLSPVPRPLLETEQPGWTIRPNPGHTGFLLDYQLNGDIQGVATINQIYLPGWKVLLDNQELSAKEIRQGLLPDGRMQVLLSPGNRRIRAWYDGPPGWRLRNGLIAALCGIAFIYQICRLYAGRFNETER